MWKWRPKVLRGVFSTAIWAELLFAVNIERATVTSHADISSACSLRIKRVPAPSVRRRGKAHGCSRESALTTNSTQRRQLARSRSDDCIDSNHNNCWAPDGYGGVRHQTASFRLNRCVICYCATNDDNMVQAHVLDLRLDNNRAL